MQLAAAAVRPWHAVLVFGFSAVSPLMPLGCADPATVDYLAGYNQTDEFRRSPYDPNVANPSRRAMKAPLIFAPESR